ncbi:DnaA regulatory inactivator Hda [Bowmanella dokdonensis]|uniref:DnaA regulatory inactivator Hda n=1 Tax=Bowmanella dokdonensis TaxID=751969 RepID=A0A939IQF7_9ALTE|nr:DnaA regulatory inactivator Hda [Bowmanella dokdonensis]MBN7824416.1 DnaA regulatory inactivator Hda [Bowmanella dokdonensis]
MSKQLFLPLQLPDDETFESFIAGDNQMVISHLQNWFATHTNAPFLTYISGEAGAGKSHLLYSLCAQVAGSGQTCAYISFKRIEELHPDFLTDLERVKLICLDDIHLLEGQADWQRAVFDLINRVKEGGDGRLLVSALQGPGQLPLDLPDLRSRLSWGVSFHLRPLDDEQRLAALRSRANRRGISMPMEVGRFLLNHCHRDMPTLLAVLDKLDKSSLQAKHRLTVPFVKKVLNL